MPSVEIKETLSRGRFGYRCQWITCGGYCEESDFTDEEARKFGCGRDRAPRTSCCVASYTCCICGTRYVGTFEAPEYYD